MNKVPELAESFLDGAEALLADRHHGVLLAAVTLILRLCDNEQKALNDVRVNRGSDARIANANPDSITRRFARAFPTW